jgi:hypothetical protein
MAEQFQKELINKYIGAKPYATRLFILSKYNCNACNIENAECNQFIGDVPSKDVFYLCDKCNNDEVKKTTNNYYYINRLMMPDWFNYTKITENNIDYNVKHIRLSATNFNQLTDVINVRVIVSAPMFGVNDSFKDLRWNNLSTESKKKLLKIINDNKWPDYYPTELKEQFIKNL